MKIKAVLKAVIAFLLVMSITQCGASMSGVRSDLGIPDPDMKKLSAATSEANTHPHKISALIEFGEQLYGAEQYYKAYDRWTYVLKLDAENGDAKSKVDRGIITMYYKMLPDVKTDADYSAKWNNQTWKNDIKTELDSAVYAKMVNKTHLPMDVIRGKSTEVIFEMKKMSVEELGLKYNGYVVYIVKRMQYFNQKELFRALKIEENIKKGNFYEAAKAIHEIPTYFPHAKFEAEKLEESVREKWAAELRKNKSMPFKYYIEHKEALFSFIRFYEGTKDSEDLKAFIEEMLYNYFNSTSIKDMKSAVEYWNNAQKFSQEFRGSKYTPLVKKSVEEKWTKYMKNNATVIVSSPQRTKNEMFAFRNAFGSSNPDLVKEVEKELDVTILRRYSGLSISDTSDINKAYTVLKDYRATFPSSDGYSSLNKTFQQKISSYILAYKIYDSESLVEAKELFSGYKSHMPTSAYIKTVKDYIDNKTNELHLESMKYYELAKESKEKNQYTLAARYVQKSLELESDNLDAKDLSVSMSEYMEAISSFNSIITDANDAATYDEAMKILNDFISKYSSYNELVSEIKSEKKRLKRYRKKWNKRAKNSFK